MTHYERSSFVAAAVISVVVHATAAVYLGHDAAATVNRPQSADSVMRVSLAPARPAELQPEPEPEPIPPPLPVKKPLPEPKPVREPLPKSEPVVEPLPTRSVEVETTEPAEEQAAAASYVEAPMDQPALDQAAIENERESYLLRMLAHIDSHKFYPRKARQRGMEGKINIVFYLHADGSISDLQVSGGSRLLRRAARQAVQQALSRQAVQQALSLPRPPESFHLQQQVRFGMVYRLDG
jgi:protein TonB